MAWGRSEEELIKFLYERINFGKKLKVAVIGNQQTHTEQNWFYVACEQRMGFAFSMC